MKPWCSTNLIQINFQTTVSQGNMFVEPLWCSVKYHDWIWRPTATSVMPGNHWTSISNSTTRKDDINLSTGKRRTASTIKLLQGERLNLGMHLSEGPELGVYFLGEAPLRKTWRNDELMLVTLSPNKISWLSRGSSLSSSTTRLRKCAYCTSFQSAWKNGDLLANLCIKFGLKKVFCTLY